MAGLKSGRKKAERGLNQRQESTMIQLTEKHRPKRIRDFAGLTRAKTIMTKLVKEPYSSGWLFTGDSGTGKTTLALAVAHELGAEVIHVASGTCNKENVERICEQCHYTPMFGTSPWRVIVVDEADQMTAAAQLTWLSRLDAANPIPNAIVIFTSNSTAKLEDRFRSRLKEISFNGAVDSKEFGDFLYQVWFDEAPAHATAPLMHKIIESSGCNVRRALNEIELELMMVPARRAA
jgi:replication-associated recombination protein RarA